MFFERGMLIKKLLSYIQGNKEYGMQFLPEFIRNKITVNNSYQKERRLNDTIKDRNFVRRTCC